MNARVSIVKSKVLHVSPECGVTKKSFNFGEIFSMELSADFSLFKDSKALVNPEMLPVSASHIVTTP